jgi:hypothetical protein
MPAVYGLFARSSRQYPAARQRPFRQLRELNLNEYPGGRLTDRGLAVLRHLPELRTFAMTWQRGITDAGLRLLHNFPTMKAPPGGSIAGDDKEPAARGARLLIDGPFTDDGLAALAGLEGVVDLDLFWHVTGITSGGFACLVDLPNLGSLGADGRLSDDEAMAHIAAMPRLRRLRAQETVATDAGFEALSRSRSLEYLWGRHCPLLGSRGFVALSKMATLVGLGVSARNVDDDALSHLPDFLALRELTPIDVNDDGFRHVGRCARLTRLACMYCRDTTDAATEHVSHLSLEYYYAGLTRITDRSLEILGGMFSLEQAEFYACRGITDAGLAFLAGLPRLRDVHLDGLPGVTFAGTRILPPGVRVQYST